LQQVGTGSDIWWRASQSPAPRPALEIPSSLRRHPRSRRHARQRFPFRRLGLAAVALSAVAFFLAAGAGARGRAPAQILPEIERLAVMAGFDLQQVSVTGHRFTPDGDVFDAVDLAHAPTMLSFDARAARQRLERLPWVERASIERVIPDRLEVRIVERAPFAVWQAEGRTFLIDKTGRVLTATTPDAMPALPHVAGEGAPTEAAALHALLARHPDLLAQIKLAQRIGGRRWTLHLADGGTIALPASGEGQALARALALTRSGAPRVSDIDLRVEGRTLVRKSRGAQDRNERVTDAQDAAGRS
jgi:cell division protein FtsQ